MGCDAYADKDGVFEMEVRDYATNRVLTRVVVKVDLTQNPRDKIALEVLKGEKR